MFPKFYQVVSWLLHCHLVLALSIHSETDIRNSASKGPVVTNGIATYVGLSNSTYNVDAWLGIPYAKAPIGKLRLQPPQPIKNEGIVNSQERGYACFQMASPTSFVTSYAQSEDCLTINIFKPSEVASKRTLPVLFWIHGGAFNSGSGIKYDAKSMANRSAELNNPAIIITINYRLSFFGFSAGTTAMANNATNLGLLDQREALKWVHENIAAFGGDPDKVTIWGESAGAMSVGLQMTANGGQTNDLFRSAILQSGAPQSNIPTPLPTWPSFQAAWDSVISIIGCQNASSEFSCVQSVPEKQLFAAVTTVGGIAVASSGSYPWQPVVDGKFISDFPSKLIAAHKVAKIPIIIGCTTDELTGVVPTNLDISSEPYLIGLIKTLLPFVPLSLIQQMVTLDSLAEYPDIGTGGTQWKRATAIISDLYQRCPSRTFAQNQTGEGVWKYRWNAVVPIDLAAAPYLGIAHAADVTYVFGTSDRPHLIEPEDIALSRIMQQAWISFAARGNPNALGDLKPGIEWPRYHKIDDQVLVFQTPNGGAGVPGEGLVVEADREDRPICEFFANNDAVFIH